ncbi:MAG TPA: NUDIX hydrolase [Candidatus Saccharimonadales bacterium]
MNRSIKVRGIAVLDGKLLCVKLKPYNGLTTEAKPYWCLPGGGVDDCEPLEEAMRREMVEELGVEPKIGRLLYVQQFAHKDNDFLEFFFHIENAQDYLHVDLGKTTHGAKEIAEIDFIDPKTPSLLPEFLQTEPLADFVASNQPAKFFARY